MENILIVYYSRKGQNCTNEGSGMNRMEQVMDNCKTFRNFQPLTERETAVVNEVTKIIEANTAVPCTHGCPKNIAIPQYFAHLPIAEYLKAAAARLEQGSSFPTRK